MGWRSLRAEKEGEVIASRPWEGVDWLVWVTGVHDHEIINDGIHAYSKMGGISASWLYGGLEAELGSHSSSDHINRFNKSLD